MENRENDVKKAEEQGLENERNQQMDDAVECRNAAGSAGAESAGSMIADIEKKVADAENDIPKKGRATRIFSIIILILVLLIAFRIGVIMFGEKNDEEMTLTNVKTQVTALGDIEMTSPLSGRIQAKDNVPVVPMTSGEVTSVNVRNGDRVKAGQVLFTIDGSHAKIQYDQAMLGVGNAKETVDLLEKNLERTKALYEEGAVSLSDVESLENSLSGARTQYENAVLSSDAASKALEYYTVKAPIGGIVNSVNVVKGGLAGSAQPSMIISDVSHLELVTNVSEYMVKSVEPGQAVDVYIKSVSAEPFSGSIVTVSEAPAMGSFSYPVSVKVNDPQGVLRAGMFAEVRLISEKKHNVVAIPSEAVITSGNEKKVAVLNSDNTVTLKKVAVGIDNGEFTEITSGLGSGEKLIVKGQTYVKDGETVNEVK